ncbi:MAG: bifunctional pyr operon transcriptional regulator/uracil phosphoribosyltransferase PyrR [Methylococcales bacterium]|nr:bifunctional pyr operon transcriptional regulator/uracil phosphoribosyltransferase PyrR [Methylococcales bacterium]
MSLPPELDTCLDQLTQSLAEAITVRALYNPVMIGIRTGGVWVAEHCHQALGLSQPLGMLDITFYRDDFSEIGVHPNVKPSELPVDIEGQDVILVDDVLYTGRTIRAALNEIFDYGRPRQVLLAVLVERNGRQIPIVADCYGAKVALEQHQRIKLLGPAPLSLTLQTVDYDRQA